MTEQAKEKSSPGSGLTIEIALYGAILVLALALRLGRPQARIMDVPEAEQAWQRAEEARRTTSLYQDALLPAARSRLAAARNGFSTGQNDFTPFIQAERSLATLELESELALAAFHQALAELAWATGSIPGLPEEEDNR